MDFICSQHRETVLATPTTAISYWGQWMQTGQEHAATGNFSQAHSFIACSFEIANWLLKKPQLIGGDKAMSYADRYVESGHQLADCYAEMGRFDLELHYLLAIHHKLCELIESGRYRHFPLQQNLQLSMRKLFVYSNQRGPFNGYQQCCIDTATLLRAPG